MPSSGAAGKAVPADDDAARERLGAALEQFATALPAAPDAARPRCLLVNPLSFSRRIGVELPGWERPPQLGGVVLWAGTSAGRHFAVVEVPAMGFAWLEPSSAAPPTSRAKPVASEHTLTNEFLQVTLSPSTGGIQSIYDYSRRGNQLSQQLALRMPAPPAEPGSAWRGSDDEGAYSTMRAHAVEVTASCPAFGEIVSRGILLGADEQPVARFRQKVQLWAGSRVIHLEVELDDLNEPRPDPWNSYYAARFAWPDETAELWRGVGLARKRTNASRLEAPEYIELESARGQVTIFTGGHPYHRRVGTRMLDTLLVVRGETSRRFRLGIGVGLSHPAAAALEFMSPPTARLAMAPSPAAASGWFFHVDARNIVATHWEPLTEQRDGQSQLGGGELPVRGFRARLMETAGRAGRVTLRAFRPLASARQIDFLGQTLVQAPVEGDRVTLDFAAYEWIEVEGLWSR
jgi:alpha-mannosidase